MFIPTSESRSHTLPTFLHYGLLLVIPLTAVPASAQAPAPAENSSFAFISQYFTEDTLAVADLNISALDPAATTRWLQEHAGLDERITPAVQMAGGLQQTLRVAGVEHVYALVAATDLPTAGAALLIPCDQPDTVVGLLTGAAEQIPEQFDYQIHREDGLVVLAPPAVWDRLRDRPAAERPDLTAALQSVSELPHRIAVAIPESLRAEMAALWPDRLPEQSPLQLSPSELMRDFRGKGVGFKLPPEPRLVVRVLTAGPEAVERTAGTASQMLELLPIKLPETQVAVQDNQVVLEFSPADFEAVLEQTVGSVAQAQGQMQDANQLKQIMLAMHHYADRHNHLPPRATANAEGQLLLSWRVMILPFINQQALYEQFRLDEPWDSPHNLALANTIPAPYLVSGPELGPGETRVRLPQIEGSAWAGEGEPLEIRDITDGTSNTIAVAIAPASEAVLWTKPEPWELDESNLVGSLFGNRDSVTVALLDGSVHQWKRSIDAGLLRALLTHQGREVVQLP